MEEYQIAELKSRAYMEKSIGLVFTILAIFEIALAALWIIGLLVIIIATLFGGGLIAYLIQYLKPVTPY